MKKDGTRLRSIKANTPTQPDLFNSTSVLCNNRPAAAVLGVSGFHSNVLRTELGHALSMAGPSRDTTV